MTLTPVESLVAKVGDHLKEDQVAKPAEQGVAHTAIARTGSKSSALHDAAHKHGGDQVLATLQGGNGNPSDLLGSLGPVGFLELFGQLGLDLLLVVEPRGEDAHGEDSVDLDVSSGSRVAVSLGIGSIVHLDLLAESIGQRANGSLGRRVRTITGDGNKRKGRAREDEVPTRVLDLATGRNGSEPFAEGGMSHVGGSPVDSVHLLTLGRDRHIDEETRVAEASTAEDNIGSTAIIPGGHFGDNAFTFSGINEISADVEEALLHGVPSMVLREG